MLAIYLYVSIETTTVSMCVDTGQYYNYEIILVSAVFKL